LPRFDDHGGARRPAGPFHGMLSHSPLQSRLAATVGVVIGLFASIVLSDAGDGVSKAALWLGVGGGVLAAAVLWVRELRR
jgi:hypothetical protein